MAAVDLGALARGGDSDGGKSSLRLLLESEIDMEDYLRAHRYRVSMVLLSVSVWPFAWTLFRVTNDPGGAAAAIER